MNALTASANIGGLAIDLAVEWSDPSGQVASLRVLRRRRGFPVGPSDGLVVLDLSRLFASPGVPWARVDRTRFLVSNAPKNMVVDEIVEPTLANGLAAETVVANTYPVQSVTLAEGGFLQAELAEYYALAGDSQPTRVDVFVYERAATVQSPTVLTSATPGGTSVSTTEGSSSAFGAITTYVISTEAAGASAPTEVGSIVVSTQAADGITPNRVDWTVGTGPNVTATVNFLRQEVQSTTASVSAPGGVFTATFVTTIGGQTIRLATFTESPNLDTGDLDRAVTITDREPPRRSVSGLDPGLDPGVTYYYSAFQVQAWQAAATYSVGDVVEYDETFYVALSAGAGSVPGTTPADWASTTPSPQWTALAVASHRYGFADKLYALLPAVHRYYDDPASGLQGTWALKRFLQIFGAGLDQMASSGAGLRSLHDIFDVRADFLPYLAQWIGWQSDQTLTTQRQRYDILFAPEVYATVGTIPNIAALVTRNTGWTCQVKEFVHNVFLTNAPEPIVLWEIWEADAASGAFSPTPSATPTGFTQAVADSIDARPAVVAEPTGGSPWLFWESNRTDTSTPPSNRRQIWMKSLDGSDAPRPVMAGAPDAGSGLTYFDQSPAALVDANGEVLRLFWTSSRDGATASLWTRTLTKGVANAPVQLTNHPAGDYMPAVVQDSSKRVWLFWHSSRRGPTDIWAMTLDPATEIWSSPQRITSGSPRDLTPSAMLDAAGILHLMWTRDLGDRTRIYSSTLTGTTWSAPVDLSSYVLPAGAVAQYRDEAPAAIMSGGNLWLYWHSNQDGIFHIWAREVSSAGSTPFPVTARRSTEKDPAPFIESGTTVRLFFRSQRGGEAFRSRTVDTTNLAALSRTEVNGSYYSQVGDRWHYVYDTGTGPTNCYSRNTVGLYMTNTTGVPAAQTQAQVNRVRAFVEDFRPLTARFVWFLGPSPV